MVVVGKASDPLGIYVDRDYIVPLPWDALERRLPYASHAVVAPLMGSNPQIQCRIVIPSPLGVNMITLVLFSAASGCF